MSVQREKECSRRLLLFTKKACLRKKVLFHTGEKYEICLSPWESGLEKEEKLTVYKRKEEVFSWTGAVKGGSPSVLSYFEAGNTDRHLMPQGRGDRAKHMC